MSKYILEDKYEDGRPKYFKRMSAIGPMATPNLEEAERYDSEDEARQSPAHRHWSANWQIAIYKEARLSKEQT